MNLRTAFVALVLIARVPAAHAAEQAPLTLEASIAFALAKNERAGKATQRVQVAVGGVDRARTAFLPTLAGQGVGAWSSTADRDGRNFSGTATFTLNQPLVNASSFPLYGQAKHTLTSERWGAVEDLRQLSFDTADAFLTACTSEQLLAAAKGRLDRARADETDSATRAQAGLTSSNDVTRATLAVATAQEQVSTAQGNLERAYLQLGYLIDQPVAGPLVPPEATTNKAKKNAWDHEEVARRAEARRPDVLSATEHTLSLRDFAREPLLRLVPTLGLSGQLREVIDPGPSDTGTSGNLSLTLTWTVFDAGARYADRRVRIAQLESASLDERALRRSVGNDIAIAAAQLRAARLVYATAQDAAVTAQKNTDETGILYKQGLAKAIEVTDANATRYDAETSLALAKLAMEQSYLNLRFALGLGAASDDVPTVGAAMRGAR